MNKTVTQTYKQLFARKYLWLFLGRIMPLLSLFFITIIYSRQLSYEDYGTFQSVWMYANIVNVIISFGFSSVIFSTNLSFLFLFIKNNRRIITSFYMVLSISGLIAFFFLSKNFTANVKIWLIAFIIIQNIITIAETLLIKRKKEKISFVINIFYALLFFGCHLFILSHYSLSNLIISLCVLSILKLFAIATVPAQNESYEPIADEKHFLKHWGYLGLNEILGVTSKWIDKVFLLYLLTASDFAVFFNGSFEIPLFGLLISVAGSFMLIEFSENIQLKNKIIALFNESFSLLSSIVFPLFFFLFFFREEIFAFVFKNKYYDSVPIFAIGIFILPLRINNFSVILQCFSQGKKVMLGSLIDIIIAIVLMIILYPFMGMKGIVLSIVISTYCQVLYYLWHSAKILHVTIWKLVPLQKLLLKFLILLALYFIIFLLLAHFSIIIKIIVGVLFTSLLIVAGLWSYLKTFFKKDYGKDG